MCGGETMNKIKKGFTLIELIIVMAIFSILMVGVMALIKPVSNMFKNTAISEKTYSYANNVQQYLQTKLEYAEDVYVGTSSDMGLTSDGVANNEKIAKLVEKLRVDSFEEAVLTHDQGNTLEYINGKIHVVRLVNKDGKDSRGKDVRKGQITHRVYDFNSKSDAKIADDTVVDEVAELNPAFLSGRDAAYDFNYSLGSGNLKTVTPTDDVGKSISTKETYKALDKDIKDDPINITHSTLSLSIVLNKRTGGTIDVPAYGENKAYKAFATPCALQIVNLPLTNISNRCGRFTDDDKTYGLKRPIKDVKNGSVRLQADGEPSWGFTKNADDQVNFDDDIYFIYCFTDEIES
jgi:prepilin-type N-terminal cleavage/methylation domain-containing protein